MLRSLHVIVVVVADNTSRVCVDVDVAFTHRYDCGSIQPRLVVEVLFVPLSLLLQQLQLSLPVGTAQ